MHDPRPRRRASRRVATLAVAALAAGSVHLASGPPAGAQEPTKPESSSPEAELAIAAAPAGGEVVKDPGGGPVTSVGMPAGQAIAVDGGGGTPRSAAHAFVVAYGAAFGEPDASDDLAVDRTTDMAAGGEAVHYQQLEGGVPVLAGELNVQVAPGGKVRSAGGELSTGDPVDVTADVPSVAAAATARAQVATDAEVDPGGLTTSDPESWVYDPELIDEVGPRRLVWRVEVRSDVLPIHAEVLVDAHSGDVVLVIDEIMEARNRQICDNQNVAGASYGCPGAGVVRSEGQSATGVTEVDRAYELSGVTYDFYKNRLNRDSINNAGMTLYSTVRHCPDPAECPYENAFWDGNQMVYGDTFAGSDDVVGHELTHGVTQYESDLVYMNQSGAINESLSDVFGELIDLTYDSSFDDDTVGARWLMGEDLPGIGAIRSMSNPPAFNDPDRMGSPHFYTGSGDSGGVHINSGVNNKAAFLLTDGGSFNGSTVTGLGITKVARIYYEAQVNLLTSGSNYAALGALLPQACNNVVGVDGITPADCTQVTNAVLATEMVQPPPANDAFANATTIIGTSGATTGTTTFATRETGEPCHGGTGCGVLQGTASIWFEFTAAGSGAASIGTCNSNYDTLLGVYTGAAVSSLTPVANNDDGRGLTCSAPYWSKVDFMVNQGTTYHVAVDGYNTSKGSVSLTWTLPAAPAPTGVSGTVTETGTGTPVDNAMVAVLRSSDYSVAGGAITDGSGNYSAQVPAGSYYLYVIDPSGSHVAGFFGPPTPVTVVNGAMTDQDPTIASTRGTIAGTVSADSPAGPVASAWALAINPSTGATETGTIANGSGQYSLTNLAARTHWAAFIDPTGARRPEFFPNSVDALGSTPIAVTGGGTSAASVSLASQSAVGAGQTISGTLTETGTGTPLVGAWVVALRASDLAMVRGAVTNGSGQYTLDLTTGSYKVGFVDPTGLHTMEWFNNQPNSGLSNATTVGAPGSASADLARSNGSIAGTVTDDVSNAAVAGAWVFAIDANGTIAGGATTAPNGTYTITGLPAGAYRVTFADPVGGRTQEYFDNSSTYGGATLVNVSGGGTASASAALHHP